MKAGMEWRDRQHLLDDCLRRLEDAHERDEVAVSAELAVEIAPYVPAITREMPIARAIDLVFEEQERSMRGALPTASAYEEALVAARQPAAPAESALDESGARQLTNRIKGAARQLCLLLLEAHRRRAWEALGYRSWEAYVRHEFNMSRSRSYEVIDQARAIVAVMDSSGLSVIPDISPQVARDIKPRLAAIAAIVRTRTRGVDEGEALAIVASVIDAERGRVRTDSQQESPHDPPPLPDGRRSVHHLREAVAALAGMPSVDTVVTWLSAEDGHRLNGLQQAAEWLDLFARRWLRAEPEDDVATG